MALSDILQKITDEANKKAAFMKQVADDEIKKINEEANKKADEKRKYIESKGEAKCLSIVEKAKVLAKMESNSSLLREKREVISDVYTGLEKELNSLDSSEYVKLLTAMMKGASEKMPKGSLIVPTGKKDQTEEAVQKANVEYHIKEETNDFKGGFIIHDSKAEVNLSFSYLISKTVRPVTELEVAKILFS